MSEQDNISVKMPDTVLGRMEMRRDAALKAAKEYQDIIDLLKANPSAESILQMVARQAQFGDWKFVT